MDNTSFGGGVPTVPQWAGPSHTVVQVQAILLASLAASLFSAFLAMLGKQWLNRYASIDMRGSIIERSQNRQRKLDGIVAWYFYHVMSSLPLMLQGSLLLLGCALSRYLWEINTTVASVVLGVTSFGVLFYIFIIVAGAASVSCPYQTPGAKVLRGVPGTLYRILRAFRRLPRIIRRTLVIVRRILDTIRRLPDVPRSLLHTSCVVCSVFSASIERSAFCDILTETWDEFKESLYSFRSITIPFLITPFLPIAVIIDVYHLVRGSVTFFRGVYSQLQQRFEQQTAALDMHCISWTLRTSLDGPVRLSVLNYLATKTLTDLDPTLVVDCFNIFLGCVKVADSHVTITQGLEQLARGAALCFLQTLSHLAAINPTSRVLEDVSHRYTTAFPLWANFDDLPFSHTLTTIHRVFYQARREQITREFRGILFKEVTWWRVRWEDYKLFNNEHTTLARALTKLAQFECQRRQHGKVPRWLLRFALHFLSQDPLPPTSVIADCLSIIAIDLDCTFPDAMAPDERCVHICQMSTSLTKN